MVHFKKQHHHKETFLVKQKRLGLDVLQDMWELIKAHPIAAFWIGLFHIWVYTLGFKHLNEFKSWIEAVKHFGF